LSKVRLAKLIEEGLITTQTVVNPHYHSGPKALLINRPQLLLHLDKAKLTEQELQEKNQRSERSRAQAQVRREAILAWVDALKITIPKMPKKKLLMEACHHYNDLWASRGRYEKQATLDDDPAFLCRITVNMLRHEYTEYEYALTNTFGKVGVEEARARIRLRIFHAISTAYPELHEECQRQAGVEFTVERPKPPLQLTLQDPNLFK
jgi:hypothetical protein